MDEMNGNIMPKSDIDIPMPECKPPKEERTNINAVLYEIEIQIKNTEYEISRFKSKLDLLYDLRNEFEKIKHKDIKM